jgi:hypothetical protein
VFSVNWVSAALWLLLLRSLRSDACFVEVVSSSMFHVISFITLLPKYRSSLRFCRSGYPSAFMLALFVLESAPSQNNPLLSPRLASSLIYLISLSSHILPLLLFSSSYPVVLQLDVLVAGAFPHECRLAKSSTTRLTTWMPPQFATIFENRRSSSELAHEISTVSLVLH